MIAPHEKMLTSAAFDKDRRCLIEDGTRMVAILRTEDADHWERFFLGAGGVVQALLALGTKDRMHGIWHATGCYALDNKEWGSKRTGCSASCKLAVTALTNAGVPLP